MISDCKRGNEGTLDAVKVSPWRFRPVSLVTFSLQVERRHACMNLSHVARGVMNTFSWSDWTSTGHYQTS